MATDKKEIELLIRARDLGSKTLKEVASAVKGVTTSLNDQVAAAKKGEISANELRDAMKKLEEAGAALIKQQGIIDHYKALGAQLDAAKEKASAMRQAEAELAASLAATDEPTRKQTRELEKMTKAADAADKRVETLGNSVAAQAERLRAAGIETDKLAAAQQKIASSAAEVGSGINVLGGALDTYQANLRETRASEEAFAKSDAFDRKIREVEGMARANLLLRQYTEALDAANAKEQQSAALTVFRQTGDDALIAARKLDDLAAAEIRVEAASDSMTAALRSIIDPAGQARATLAGLEAETARVINVVGDADKPIRDYQDAINDLGRIQTDVLRKGALVDSFAAQEKAVESVTIAYRDAYKDVQFYARAIQDAEEPNDALTNGLRRSEAALKSATTELEQEKAALARLKASMDAAGISTTDLVGEQSRLIGIANSAAGAITKLDKAQAGQNTKTGRFLGLRAYELQNLGYQVNDLITQVASGTSVMQAAAQQGGQILQLFPGIFAKIAAFIPELLLVGAVAGTTIAAIKQVLDEAESVRKFTGELTLNADGALYNAQALAATAHTLDVYGASLKDARAEVSKFIAEGLDPAKIEAYGKSAQDMADVLGIKVPDAAGKVAAAFTGGYEALKKFDDEVNFLTAAEREHIKTLYEQGDAAAASDEAFRLWADRVGEAADQARGPWTDASRGLQAAWDSFITTVSNTDGIVNTVKELNTLISVARDALNWLAQVDEAKAKPDASGTTYSQRPRFSYDAPAILGGGYIGIGSPMLTPQASMQGIQDLLKQSPKDKENQRQTKAADAQIDKLREARKATDLLSAAEKVRLAGIKAVTDAENAGLNDKGLLAKIRDEAQLTEQYKQQEKAKKKSDAQGRKDDSAKRAAEAKERAAQAKRDALERQLTNDLNTMTGKVDKSQVASLDQRLEAVDGAYAKISDALARYKAAGGTNVNGQSLADYQKQIDANKDILKQQETMKFYEETLSELEKQRASRLQGIADQAAAGTISGAEAFKQAQAVVADLDPKIANAADFAQQFAESIRGAVPDPKLDAFIEKMKQLSVANSSERGTNTPLALAGIEQAARAEGQLNAAIEQRTELISAVNRLEELGAISHAEAVDRRRAAYEQTTPLIQKEAEQLQELLRLLAETGAITPQIFDTWKAKLQAINVETVYVDENFTKIHDAITGSLTTGFSTFLTSVAQGIAGVIDGTMTWEEALDSLGNAALNFTATFLQGIADVLMQIAVLQAIKSIPFLNNLTSGIMDFTGLTAGATSLGAASTSLVAGTTGLTAGASALTAGASVLTTASASLAPASAALATAGGVVGASAAAMSVAAAALAQAATIQLAANSVGVFHSGGVIGGTANRTRSINPAIFANAPRYHSGTYGAGLKANEQAAILQKGEEVLTADNPRHIKNQIAGATGASSGGQPIAIYNALDTEDAAMKIIGGPAGTKAVMNILKFNATSVKAIVNS